MTNDLETLRLLDQEYVMPTYRRLPVTFVRGEGAYLWDSEGNKYLDFLSGISVSNVGHCHPQVVAAVREQAATLLHSSNLIYSEPALRLSERLARCSLAGKVFLANSGAEANEAAIKIARKRAFLRHPEKHPKCHPEDPERSEGAEGSAVAAQEGVIAVVEGGFHGRTLGALSATPQESKQAPFAPMVPGFKVVGRNDSEALKKLADSRLIAILLEPIQGETGVNILCDDFLRSARDLCDQKGALLIFDEVQSGLGRSGTLWAYEQTTVKPDLLTVAKSLGGGLPIGAVISTPEYGDVLEVGEHGSTFAGSPLVARAALAALSVLEEQPLLDRVKELGQRLGEGLNQLVEAGSASEARGRGLIWALDLLADASAPDLVERALGHGIVLNSTSDQTLRFLPPLIIGEEEVDRVLEFLQEELRG